MVRASSFGTGWGDRQFDADVPPPEGEVEPTVVEELRTNCLNRVRVSSLMTMRSGPALPRGTLVAQGDPWPWPGSLAGG